MWWFVFLKVSGEIFAATTHGTIPRCLIHDDNNIILKVDMKIVCLEEFDSITLGF